MESNSRDNNDGDGSKVGVTVTNDQNDKDDFIDDFAMISNLSSQMSSLTSLCSKIKLETGTSYYNGINGNGQPHDGELGKGAAGFGHDSVPGPDCYAYGDNWKTPSSGTATMTLTEVASGSGGKDGVRDGFVTFGNVRVKTTNEPHIVQTTNDLMDDIIRKNDGHQTTPTDTIVSTMNNITTPLDSSVPREGTPPRTNSLIPGMSPVVGGGTLEKENDQEAIQPQSEQQQEFPKEGIRFSYILNNFVQPHRDKLKGMTTREVCQQIIMPTTSLDRTSFCHMLVRKNLGYDWVSSTPSVFISHAHSYPFLDVISALQYHLRNELDTVIWFDLFSINQHLTTDWSFEWLSTTFKSAIGQFGRIIMIMKPWNNPLPFTRAWCVFEAYCSAVTNAKFEIALSENDEKQFLKDVVARDTQNQINDMLLQIRSENSLCFSETDKERIFDVIRKEVGFAKLDSMVFECYRSWVIDITSSELQKCTQEHRNHDRVLLLGVLGNLHLGQGGLRSAERYLREGVELSRSDRIGLDYHLKLKSQLADVYSQLGRHDEAMGIFIDCLQKQRKPIDILKTMSKFAALYESRNEYGKALSLYNNCIKKFQSQLGRNHPYTLVTMSKLAATHAKVGNHKKSLPLFEECLRGQVAEIGRDHVDTLTTRHNFGLLYLQGLNRPDKALPMLYECWKRREVQLGKDHIHTVQSRHAVSDLYRNNPKLPRMHDQQSTDPSQPRGTHTNDSRLKKSSKNPSFQATDELGRKIFQAHSYYERHEYDLARQLYEEIMTLMDSERPEKLTVWNNLGHLYCQANMGPEARDLLTACFKERQNRYGRDHVDTLTTMDWLACSYTILNASDEMALNLLLECYRKRKVLLGDDHVDTLRSMNNLSFHYFQIGQYETSSVLCRKCLEKRQTILGEHHYETIESQHNLAMAFEKMYDGNLNRAFSIA